MTDRRKENADSSEPSPSFIDAGNSPPRTIDVLSIPKNRSTGNLPIVSSAAQNAGTGARIRFSFDAGKPSEHESIPRSPVMGDHEHGLGVSGLRRIRQQPVSRAPTLPPSPESSFTLPSRSSSMTMNMSKTFTQAGPSSPTLNFSEDLSRFPSESLHSFSFAHQSEEALHNRQNVLKRSIDFLRDRLGWAANHPGLVSAQAKASGDVEVQKVMELLARANMLGSESEDYVGPMNHGPLTGPALTEGENVFDQDFAPQSESPTNISPTTTTKGENFAKHVSRQISTHPKTEVDEKKSSLGFITNQGSERDPMSPMLTQSTTRTGLKRTYTDTTSLTLQTKLMEILSKPYSTNDPSDSQLLSPTMISTTAIGKGYNAMNHEGMSTHHHAHRWAPAAQAIFTTETQAPWTILAANDLACLVFGVTKAEVRKLGILEVVREDRREWLEEKLKAPGSEAAARARSPYTKSRKSSQSSSTSMAMGGGITALLLRKPPARQTANRRSQTDDGSGSSLNKKTTTKGSSFHHNNQSRGVLLCGDVIPIQKRNGATGSASLWVKEKRGGLIWVLEEITEDIALLTLDEQGKVLDASGAIDVIWNDINIVERSDIRKLVPCVPMVESKRDTVDYESINKLEHFTAKNPDGFNVPVSISTEPNLGELRLSSFPHIAGILVLSATTLKISSFNSVFVAALFGQSDPVGLHITQLIPQFDKILTLLSEEEQVNLVDGLVIPEHSFRRARGLMALREGSADAAAIFLNPNGLAAKHRDGSEILVDVQLRVVKSKPTVPEEFVIEEKSEDESGSDRGIDVEVPSHVVYALWITYSRHLHSVAGTAGISTPLLSPPGSPRQPSPGQSVNFITPEAMDVEETRATSPTALLTQKIKEATSEPISIQPHKVPTVDIKASSPAIKEPSKKKKTISEFVILEEMGQGAYGQVKLGRYKKPPANKVVLKYVTKKRILVDTWTRDRRLGTVPLEIHVLDYLRRDELKHPNIVEMTDFFEDNINYYIEMVPHGLPGMDLFDYIEMRSTMEEAECKNIFLQVAAALHHLHTKALVVHRDIKDENIIMDGENQVKLIDFGSAAYIKNGPFDVFVGTIDYAAPEVLQGKSYRGKEQDVWALGILLYTLVYKENPFYSVDEILDHELRIPWVTSEGSIDLIKAMLNRDVESRLTISQVQDHPWCVSEEAVEDRA